MFEAYCQVKPHASDLCFDMEECISQDSLRDVGGMCRMCELNDGNK